MKLDVKDKEIIFKALIDYENNYYASEGKVWQRKINKLIETFKSEKKVLEF